MHAMQTANIAPPSIIAVCTDWGPSSLLVLAFLSRAGACAWRHAARTCCMTKRAAGTSMGQERPRISEAWCRASWRKPSPRWLAVRADSAAWAPTHTSSLISSVHITATDARYCVPARVL